MFVLAGLHCRSPAALPIGIWTLATAELYGSDDADDIRLRDEVLHVGSALLLVVLAVDGVVEWLDLEHVAAGAAGGVDLVDSQLGALERRHAVGSGAAREREARRRS